MSCTVNVSNCVGCWSLESFLQAEVVHPSNPPSLCGKARLVETHVSVKTHNWILGTDKGPGFFRVKACGTENQHIYNSSRREWRILMSVVNNPQRNSSQGLSSSQPFLPNLKWRQGVSPSLPKKTSSLAGGFNPSEKYDRQDKRRK